MKKHSRTGIFVRIAALVFAAFCVVSVVKIQMEYNELKEEKEAKQERVEQLTQQIEKTQKDLSTPFDEDYIVRVAKEKLNLRLPEEIIFYNDFAN